MEITPIKRFNLPNEVIKQIEKIIINGKLKPGDKLPPERELAERFRVGRTTIREALKALDYANIIIRTREGTIINNNTFELFTDSFYKKLIYKHIDLTDLIEVRKILEVENVSLAAQRATTEDISVIQNILFNIQKVVNNRSNSKFISADIKFHEAIAEAAQNRVLYEVFISIHSLLRESQEMVVKYPGIMKRSLGYHEKIYSAIKEKKVCVAKEAMLDHLDDVNKALKSLRIL